MVKVLLILIHAISFICVNLYLLWSNPKTQIRYVLVSTDFVNEISWMFSELGPKPIKSILGIDCLYRPDQWTMELTIPLQSKQKRIIIQAWLLSSEHSQQIDLCKTDFVISAEIQMPPDVRMRWGGGKPLFPQIEMQYSIQLKQNACDLELTQGYMILLLVLCQV